MSVEPDDESVFELAPPGRVVSMDYYMEWSFYVLIDDPTHYRLLSIRPYDYDNGSFLYEITGSVAKNALSHTLTDGVQVPADCRAPDKGHFYVVISGVKETPQKRHTSQA